MELCDLTMNDFIIQKQTEIGKLFKEDTTDNLINYLKIYLSICKAIEYIHNDCNIIHRDLKPANIFLINEDVRVGDFGLATFKSNIKYVKFGRRDSDLSYHTKNVGTTLYASEEQLNSHYYDFKVNLFNLV